MKLTLVNFRSHEEIDLEAKDPVIIGRGSLFGCTDKKVSRNHGQIQLTEDGNVHLLALHVNPCFFMKNGLPPVCQLAKNEEKILNNGDYIGLLPDSFWYKIVVKKNDDEGDLEIPVNSSDNISAEGQSSKGDECETVTDIDSQTTVGELSNHSKQIEDSEKIALNSTEIVAESSKPAYINSEPSNSWLAERLKALEKTKKLPLSMYEIDDFPEIIEADKHKKCCDVINNAETQPDENEDCNREDLNSEVTTVCSNQSATSSKIIDQEENVIKENVQTVQLDSDDAALNVSEQICDISNSPKNNGINAGNSQTRPICQYEKNCYRKNEQHRKEYCHPGDLDFLPYSKRPKCQYGASCYRKNKAHFVEFQHPRSKRVKTKSPPGSPKKKRPKKKDDTIPDTFEEEDDEMDDPFADNGSSDEYIPSDLDSDDLASDL